MAASSWPVSPEEGPAKQSIYSRRHTTPHKDAAAAAAAAASPSPKKTFEEEPLRLPPLSSIFMHEALPIQAVASSGPQRRSPLLQHAILGATSLALEGSAQMAGRSLSPHPYQNAREGRRSPFAPDSASSSSGSSLPPPTTSASSYSVFRSVSLPSPTTEHPLQSMPVPLDATKRLSSSASDRPPSFFNNDSYFPRMQTPPPVVVHPPLLHSHSAPAGELPMAGQYKAERVHDPLFAEPLKSAPLLGRDTPGAGEQKEIKSKRPHKKKQVPDSCAACGVTATPEWRKGPSGNRTLCNACGLQSQKLFGERGFATTPEGIQEQLRVLGDARRARAGRLVPIGAYALPSPQVLVSDSMARPLSYPLQQDQPIFSFPGYQSGALLPSPLLLRPLLPLPSPLRSTPIPLPRSAVAEMQQQTEEEEAARSLEALSLPPSFPPSWLMDEEHTFTGSKSLYRSDVQ